MKLPVFKSIGRLFRVIAKPWWLAHDEIDQFQPLSRIVYACRIACVICIWGYSGMIATANAASKPLTLVALGDSLTAGYGLAQSEAFPVVLEKRLKDLGLDVTVINGGVSGDTASGGLERLDWTVPEGTHGVIVELGANDALRGIDPAITRESLKKIIQSLQGRGIRVMLAGMLAPRNMGAEFRSTRSSSTALQLTQLYCFLMACTRRRQASSVLFQKCCPAFKPLSCRSRNHSPISVLEYHNEISHSRPFRNEGEYDLSRHDDLWRAEYRGRGPCTDGLCAWRGREFL
jgi:hypothetical protein